MSVLRSRSKKSASRFCKNSFANKQKSPKENLGACWLSNNLIYSASFVELMFFSLIFAFLPVSSRK